MSQGLPLVSIAGNQLIWRPGLQKTDAPVRAELPSLAVCLLLALFAPRGMLHGETRVLVREQVGKDWSGELVHWKLLGEGEWHLVDGKGRPVPAQRYEHVAPVRTPLEGPGLYALVDLAAGSTLDWRVVRGAPPPVRSRVRVTTEADVLTLASEVLEVRLPFGPAGTVEKELCPAILAMRLRGADWIGDGGLSAPGKLRSCTTRVTAEGPLFVEAEVDYTFSEGRRYLCRVRLVGREPVVHVTESFSLGSGGQWTFRIRTTPALDRCHGVYQSLPGHLKAPGEKALEPGTLGLVARLRAWGGFTGPDAAWFAAWNSVGGGPVFGVFTTFPKVWTRPGGHPHDTRWYQVGPEPIQVLREADGAIACQWPLDNGTRSYCLYLVPRERYLRRSPNGIAAAKRQYGETPLQRAKDWVLDWPERTRYPQLFFAREDIPDLRKRLKGFPSLAARFSPSPGTVAFLEDLTGYYLASGDEAAVARIVNGKNKTGEPRMAMHGDGLLPELRMRAGSMLSGRGLWPPGINTIMWLPDHLMFRVLSADVALGSESLPPGERRELRKLLTIMAYQMESPEMVPPRECGFQLGTPNMPAPFYATLGMIGALLPDHPHAERWMARASRELKESLYWLSLPDGTWAESYMYQERVMRALVPAAVALARHGQPDLMADPRMQAVLRAQVAQLAPRDPRNSVRNFAAIGDGTWHAPKPTILAAAAAVAPHDPTLASELAWAWHQHGEPYAGMLNEVNPYVWVLGDPSLPQQPPALTSQVFEGAGAILRSRFNTKSETYLHLRAASFATSHFEDDQLSFSWYAKGAPLCLDWGHYYLEGTRGADMHNRTVLDDRSAHGAQIVKAVFLPSLDYVVVRNGPSNASVRRLLLVRGDKDTDPECVVLRDSLSGPGRWNVWTLASGIEMKLDERKARKGEETEEDGEVGETEEDEELARMARKDLAPTDPMALLQQPLLPASSRGRLDPFEVPLLGRSVRYLGTYGVDLTVAWLSPVTRVEMGAYQWGIRQPAKPGTPQRGEHQKLLRLHRDSAGGFLVALCPHLHDQEPEPVIEPWGDGGVKISRPDGFMHHAWLSSSPPVPGGLATVAGAFRDEKAEIEGEAFVACERPDGVLELSLLEGTKLWFREVRAQTDKPGSFSLRITRDGVTGESLGEERELRLSLPMLEGKPAVSVGGKSAPAGAARGTFRFVLPSGRGHIGIPRGVADEEDP